MGTNAFSAPQETKIPALKKELGFHEPTILL